MVLWRRAPFSPIHSVTHLHALHFPACFLAQFLGVPATLRCMRHWADDVEMQEAAVLALLRLLSAADDVESLLRESGLDTLLEAARAFPENHDIVGCCHGIVDEIEHFCGRSDNLRAEVEQLDSFRALSALGDGGQQDHHQ